MYPPVAPPILAAARREPPARNRAREAVTPGVADHSPSLREAKIRPRRRLSPAALLAIAALAGLGGGPSPAHGQAPAVVGAELPQPGELWLDLSPTFESWSEQFAMGSESVADGSREPLYAHYDGALAERLYPGPELVAASVSRGGDSLGFGALDAGEVALGSLQFRDLTAHRTSVPLRATLGVTDRVAVEVGVAFVQTETDATFRYDSAGATVAPASLAVPDGKGYLDALASARSALEDVIQDGGLPSGEEQAAQELLIRSGKFATVLGRKFDSGGLLPLAGSRAGDEMAALASALDSSFEAFDVEAPPLDLAPVPGPGALDAFLDGPLVDARPLRGEGIGLGPAGMDVGLRVGLLDSFGRDGSPGHGGAGRSGGLALRTTAGLRLHLPLGEPDAAPFLTPNRFLDTPAGAGTRIVEAALFQDAALGALRASAAAGYGLRLSDRTTLRVHAPGRPFALRATLTELDRDPGDYFWLRFSPRLSVNSHLSMGGEYAYWRQGRTNFSAVGSDGVGAPGADPSDLERETSARRHSLGVGVYYTAGAGGGDGAGPLEAAFTYRLAVSGSGGQTPAAGRMGVRFRVPVSVGIF